MNLNPLDELSTLLPQGRCVLFAGAGLSAFSGLPTWRELTQELLDRATREGLLEPGGKLHKAAESGDLDSVSDLLSDAIGHVNLVERTRQILESASAKPNEVHHLLAGMNFASAFTSNWDSLLEETFQRLVGKAEPNRSRASIHVSYAWEGEGYRTRVEDLAKRLRSAGFDVKLELLPEIPDETQDASIESDHVIVLCSPAYGKQFGTFMGSFLWPFEESFEETPSKFIPILFQGNWPNSAPRALAKAKHIDLRLNEPKLSDGYLALLSRLGSIETGIQPFIRKRILGWTARRFLVSRRGVNSSSAN